MSAGSLLKAAAIMGGACAYMTAACLVSVFVAVWAMGPFLLGPLLLFYVWCFALDFEQEKREKKARP